MESCDISAAKTTFLKIMHESRQAGVVNVYCVQEMWVNQTRIHYSCGKRSDRSDGLNVPPGKGGRLINVTWDQLT
jgi:hypothetical protein